jgi:glutaredoxin
MTILLFTSKTCEYCSVEREYLKEHNINFIEIDVHSDSFGYLKKDLLQNGIILRCVPAIIKKDGNKMELIENRRSLF